MSPANRFDAAAKGSALRRRAPGTVAAPAPEESTPPATPAAAPSAPAAPAPAAPPAAPKPPAPAAKPTPVSTAAVAHTMRVPADVLARWDALIDDLGRSKTDAITAALVQFMDNDLASIDATILATKKARREGK
jgi:predicted transcriptional regulator